jgi:hypothetical protein
MADEKSKKKPAPGWYKDPKKPDQDRRWDGERWLDEWRSPPLTFGQRPEGYMVAGIALAIGLGLLAGAVMAVDDEGFGLIALWIATAVSGTVFTIGVFGKAVEIGVRAARRSP